MVPPRRVAFFIVSSAIAFLLAVAVSSFGAPPVFDPVAILDPSVPADPPKIPVGKALVIPISATETAGGPLSFKVSSSNPKFPVRIKTGNPILRIHVTYAGDGAASAAFAGDLDFQLFRDFAPVTSAFIAGFAQAGYYDNLTFHRIIEDFMAQGGDPAGTGNGNSNGTYIGLPFDFENEFQPALIFVGRGQLAMANSGLSRGSQILGSSDPRILLGDFTATNGSQFFVTFEQLRAPTTANPLRANLDFKHTIFGQLIRGFDLLTKIEAVPTNASDKPTVDVKMASVTVRPGMTEATVFVGATGPGQTNITVIATDSNGEIAKQTFVARAVNDVVNDPPIMLPFSPIYANIGGKPQLSVNAVDLELDYLLYGIAAAGSGTSPSSFGTAGIISDYSPISTTGKQTLALGVTGFNDQRRLIPASAASPFAPFDPYNFQVVSLVFGDTPAREETVDVKGAPGVAFTNVVVGKLHDLDAAGTPSNFTAKVNWGDGTALSTGTVSLDTSTPGATNYSIAGTHTYAKAGIYPVVVTGAGDKGAVATIRGTAVISAAPLVATGRHNDVIGSKLTNRILATFTDANSTRRPADYVATVDWGDGVVGGGSITRAPDGSFLVRGSHVFKDTQIYSIAVRVHKRSDAATIESVAWSTAFPRFTSSRYAPPFPQVHLVAAWNSGPNKSFTNTIAGSFVPADLRVQLAGNFVVVNSGNLALSTGKIRFWLSSDAVLTTTGANADTRLKVNGVTELTLSQIGAGGGGSGNFTIALPNGESGGGKYLLAELVYTDPIADHSAVDKVVISGPIDPAIVVFDRTGSLNGAGTQTSEGGGFVTFKVVLDTAPTAEVKIPVVSSLTTEGTVDKTELIFNAGNWNVAQIVKVTGVDDSADDGDKIYKVTLQTPVTTDPNYLGLAARDISLINLDNDP